MSLLLLKKRVDWSLLSYGFNIPLEFQPLVQALFDHPISHGEKRKVNVVINGTSYGATLNNIGFDKDKYSEHKDMLQVRYSNSSQLAKTLQMIFQPSLDYITNVRRLPENKGKQVRLPEDINEYMALYSSSDPDTFIMECFTDAENKQISQDVCRYHELEYEMLDNNTGYAARLTKVRVLDRSIEESLKLLYGNRCQITGEKVGAEYGNEVIEAHHIEFFTQSLNNDSNNIIILSPNFHRIIHKNLPVFNRDKLEFRFQNGVVEKVRLDRHLNVKPSESLLG